jgi:hypothetical protein
MNLIGAMLTRQATWQIILEVYYVTADLTLVLQYVNRNRSFNSRLLRHTATPIRQHHHS